MYFRFNFIKRFIFTIDYNLDKLLIILPILIAALNILLGVIFLIIPLIFIELGRPKDLLKAGLFLLLGIFSILKANTFNYEYIIVMGISSLLIIFLVFELFSNRWNQLSKKEKKEIKTFSVISSKSLLFLKAIKITFENFYSNIVKENFLRNNTNSKKWIRSENSDNKNNIENLKFNSSSIFGESTNIPKEDIINDEKI